MSWLVRTLTSSIGKKQILALTGLALCGFLVTHLAGNFLIFVGQEAFDKYAHTLESSTWLVIPAEIVLLLLFGSHIGLAIRVTIENKKARGGRYKVRNNRGSETAASSTMIFSGIIILVFLVLHIIGFKFGERIDGSLYKLVLKTFQDSAGIVIWYVSACCVLGLHLSHGFQSAFRSLGLDHPKYQNLVRRIGIGFAVAIAIGYSSLPIYARWFADKI